MPKYFILFCFFILYGCSQNNELSKQTNQIPLQWNEHTKFVFKMEGNNRTSDHLELRIFNDSAILIDGFADHLNIVKFNLTKIEKDSILLLLERADFLETDSRLILNRSDSIDSETEEFILSTNEFEKSVLIDFYNLNQEKYIPLSKVSKFISDILIRKLKNFYAYIDFEISPKCNPDSTKIIFIDYSLWHNANEWSEGKWGLDWPLEMLSGSKKIEINILNPVDERLLFDTLLQINCKAGDTVKVGIDFVNGKYISSITGF